MTSYWYLSVYKVEVITTADNGNMNYLQMAEQGRDD